MRRIRQLTLNHSGRVSAVLVECDLVRSWTSSWASPSKCNLLHCDVFCCRQIRFSYRKLFIDVKGTFVSQTRLTCLTPNFTDTGIPPGTVDVRVCLAGESFTTTKAEFTFFPVTDASFSFLYGPSLLEEGAPGRETMFVIQVTLTYC